MDKYSALSGAIDRLVNDARSDFEAMQKTHDQHPCDGCLITLRNKRVRLNTLVEVQRTAQAVR